MQNSKLFRVLKQLNDKEMERFSEFVGSAYFNKNKELAPLLAFILEKTLLHSEAIDAGTVLRELYPGRPFQDRLVHDVCYRLMNLLEEFLALEKYRQNSFQQKINLMMLAYEKEMEPIISGIERDLEQMHTQTPLRDTNYLYETFMIHSERDYSFRLLGKITENENLQRKADHLDLFYLALKLKDNCEMLNRSKIVSASYDFKMMDMLVDYLLGQPDMYESHPAIHIYLHIYLMLSRPEHEYHYNRFRELAIQYEKAFTAEELRSFYQYAQNYCIRRVNQGDTGFINQLFEVYKHILAAGLVFGDNTNMQWDFKNFVSLGLRMKEYEWTKSIINTFKDELPENTRQNAYTYNLANYYYETGEYKKATKLLNSVEFTDIYYNLDSKAMLLKIYYKVEEEESFYALVSSFGIYLRRNKLISKDNVEVYENLLKYIKKAFLLKTKPVYERKKDYYKNVASLKQKITETRHVANINWLLGEVGALEGANL